MSNVIYSPSVNRSSPLSVSIGSSSSDTADSHIQLWKSLQKNSSSKSFNNTTINNSFSGSFNDLNNKLNHLNKMNNEQYNALLSDFIKEQRSYNNNLFSSVNKYNDTAYQRLVKDLKLAGLNPMLATFNVSPNRVSSVPYSNNVPNFSEFKNDFNYVFQYLLALLNHANKSDLMFLQNSLDKDYFKYSSEFTPYNEGKSDIAMAMNYIGYIIKSLSPLIPLGSAVISRNR